MTWDHAAKVLNPDAFTELRERWQPRVDRTAVVTDVTRQAAMTTSGMNGGVKPIGTNVVMQSALFEFLVLRARRALSLPPKPTGRSPDRWY